MEIDAKPVILIIDDDPGIHEMLPWSIQGVMGDVSIVHAMNANEAFTALSQHSPDVAIIDLGLPPAAAGASEGLRIIEAIRNSPENLSHTQLIVFSGSTDINEQMDVARHRVNFIPKDTGTDIIGLLVKSSAEQAKLIKRIKSLEEQLPNSDTVIRGNSPAIRNAIRLLERVAPANNSVFIHGESGVGKELFARRLHQASGRPGAFVSINCAGHQETLLDSELFGHEKGAFTGAVSTRVGLIETAQNGTLFLDEIGDMPLSLQVKMLRFLQERVIRRVGGTKEIKVDVRIVCATHRNLMEMCREKTFREDLYYRINDVVLDIPPLRERGHDILILANAELQRLKADNPALFGHIEGFDHTAKEAMLQCEWRGNVRELLSSVGRAGLFCDGNFIIATDLGIATPAHIEKIQPCATIKPESAHLPDSIPEVLPLHKYMHGIKNTYIHHVIMLCDGRKKDAAELLGISRSSLYEALSPGNAEDNEKGA